MYKKKVSESEDVQKTYSDQNHQVLSKIEKLQSSKS